VTVSESLLSGLPLGAFYLTFPSREIVGVDKKFGTIPFAAFLPSQVLSFSSLVTARQGYNRIQQAVSRMNKMDRVVFLHAVGVWPHLRHRLDQTRPSEDWKDVLDLPIPLLVLTIQRVVQSDIASKVSAGR
jgi:hypothetical protein